ncbi:MAG: MqnA/MqnD/SBP family protein, partial [Vicinamibacteria bacterium]
MTFAFSSCPNDTFAFHAWVHGLVPGPPVDVHMDDIEALNQRAARGEATVTKLSMAAYGHLRDDFVLLRAGGAAGFGVGPIVVARDARPVGGRIAIPGERTTAALLLRLLGRFVIESADCIPLALGVLEQETLGLVPLSAWQGAPLEDWISAMTDGWLE